MNPETSNPNTSSSDTTITAQTTAQLSPIVSLLRQSWVRYNANIRRLVAIAWLPIVINTILSVYMFLMASVFIDALKKHVGLKMILTYLFLTIVLFIASFILNITYHIAQLYTLSDESVRPRQAYERATPLVYKYIWVSILFFLVVMGGSVFLIIPGVIFAILFSFSPYIVVFEGLKGNQALKRSREYVKGMFLPIAFRFIVVALISIVCSTLFSSIGRVIDIGLPNGVGQLMVDILYGIVIAPYFAVYMYEMYLDVKKAR